MRMTVTPALPACEVIVSYYKKTLAQCPPWRKVLYELAASVTVIFLIKVLGVSNHSFGHLPVSLGRTS
jgi:hypothetical protein